MEHTLLLINLYLLKEYKIFRNFCSIYYTYLNCTFSHAENIIMEIININQIVILLIFLYCILPCFRYILNFWTWGFLLKLCLKSGNFNKASVLTIPDNVNDKQTNKYWTYSYVYGPFTKYVDNTRFKIEINRECMEIAWSNGETAHRCIRQAAAS